MSAISCPKCRDSLDSTGKPVPTCNGCEGVWLARKQYDSLLTQTGSSVNLAVLLEKKPGTAGLSCPECPDIQLSVSTHAGVEVDWCEKCNGVFFDKGELSRIREYLSGLRTAGDTGVTPTAADLTVTSAADLFFSAIGKITSIV